MVILTWTYHVRYKDPSAVYMCSIMVHILLPTTALEREDHVAKFRFKYLGIVEVSSG